MYRIWWPKPSPRKRNATRPPLVSGGLTNSWEKKSTKGKGEREIYPIEYRVPKYRRDKKAFFGEQCKERDESNTMGKTRDLFKKTSYQINISCKTGTIKGKKMARTWKKQKRLRKGGKNTQETVQKSS